MEVGYEQVSFEISFIGRSYATSGVKPVLRIAAASICAPTGLSTRTRLAVIAPLLWWTESEFSIALAMAGRSSTRGSLTFQ